MAHDEERRSQNGEPVVDRRAAIRLAVIAVLVTLVVLFGVANADSVPVDYLVDTREIPLVWVIVVSLVVGAIIERMFFFVLRRRRRD